jgi:hypothetical protein
MKHNPALAISQNANRAFDPGPPPPHSALPPTRRQVISGIETERDFTHQPLSSGFFGKSVRHYRLTARGISAAAVTLAPLASAEIEGAARLVSSDSGVVVTHGIPTPPNGTMFKVFRRADLFAGGTIETLEPGEYVAGDTIACEKQRRIYLELHHDHSTSIAVVGVFMQGHHPASMDWRVTEPSARNA